MGRLSKTKSIFLEDRYEFMLQYCIRQLQSSVCIQSHGLCLPMFTENRNSTKISSGCMFFFLLRISSLNSQFSIYTEFKFRIIATSKFKPRRRKIKSLISLSLNLVSNSCMRKSKPETLVHLQHSCIFFVLKHAIHAI